MYYHGTKAENANDILAKGFFNPSIGDHHWLGDGYYFYSDAEYAFRWILLKYTQNFTNIFKINYDKIFEVYTILSVSLHPSSRFFSLDQIKHKTLFIKVKNEIRKKAEYSKRYQEQIKREGIADGVIINILFEYMGYDQRFDVVEATFPIALSNCDSRLDFLPEKQICVKNLHMIQNPQKWNCDSVPENFKIFIDDYMQSKKLLRQSSQNSIAQKYKKKGTAKRNYSYVNKRRD